MPGGRAIEAFTPVREQRIDSRALEKDVQQLPRKTLGVLLPEKQITRDVLVDLRLQLQLQKRNGLVVTRVPREVHEVTHAFERRPVVGNVLLIELHQRTGPLKPLQKV